MMSEARDRVSHILVSQWLLGNPDSRGQIGDGSVSAKLGDWKERELQAMMEKAGRALRRSGVRLRSMGCGHADTALVISGMRDIRAGMKSFQSAQSQMTQDMVVWARNDENRAFKDVMERINELNFLWADSLKDFYEALDAFRVHYEMIHEGEKAVDLSGVDFCAAERKERRIKRNLKKISKRASAEKMMRVEMELSDAERAKDLAQYEAIKAAQENEVCKMIRIKEGLTKLTESYLDMAQKMAIVFEAQREVVQAIPDVQNVAIHELTYSGYGRTKQTVQKAKDRIEKYHTLKFKLVPQGIAELPPPYTPGFFDPATGLPHDLDDTTPNFRELRRSLRAEPRAPPLESVEGSTLDTSDDDASNAHRYKENF